MFTVEILEKLSENKNKVYISDHNGTRNTTYFEFKETAFRIANALKLLNLKIGEFIVICMPNCMEYYATIFACWILNLVPVPTGETFPKERIDYIVSETKAKIIIDMDFCKNAIDNRQCEIVTPKLEDNAFLLYTSGSTGKPKGVIITYKDIDEKLKQEFIPNKYNDNVVFGNTAPPYFIASIIVWYIALSSGTIHLFDTGVVKSTKLIAEYIEKHKITVCYMSPAVLRCFHNKSESLKAVISIGEKLTTQYSKEGYDLLNFYGQTETIGKVGHYVLPNYKMDDVPININAKGLEYRIVDEEGNDVKIGEIGELILRGNLFKEYFNDKKTTTSKIVNGWFHTGDIFRLISENGVVYVNRKDFMIKINGQRVEPSEIETAICEIPFIQNAVVKGFKKDGERNYLCAYFILKQDFSNMKQPERKIREALEKKLMPYMIPSFFMQMESFPLNANGKIDRNSLKEPDANYYKSEYRAPENDLQKKICDTFEKILNVSKISIDDELMLLGLDSIDCMNAVEKLQSDYKIECSTKTIYEFKTPRKIAESVSRSAILDLDKQSQIAIKNDQPLLPIQVYYIDYQLYVPNKVATNHPVFITMKNDGEILFKLKEAFNKLLHNFSVFGSIIVLNDEEKYVLRYQKDLIKDIEIVYVSEDDIEKIKEDIVKLDFIFNDLLYKFRICVTKEHVYLLLVFNHVLFDGTAICNIIKNLYLYMDGKQFEMDYYYYYLQKQKEICDLVDENDIVKRIENSELVSKIPRPDFENNGNISFENVIMSKHPYLDYINAIDKKNTTMATVQIAATLLALSRYNNKKNTAVEWFYNGRDEQWMNGLTGLTIQMIPIEIDFEKIIDNDDLLKRVDEIKTIGIINGNNKKNYSFYSPGKDEYMQVLYQYGVHNYDFLPKDVSLEFGFKYINASLAMFQSIINKQEDDKLFNMIVVCNLSRYKKETAINFGNMIMDAMDEILGFSV